MFFFKILADQKRQTVDSSSYLSTKLIDGLLNLLLKYLGVNNLYISSYQPVWFVFAWCIKFDTKVAGISHTSVSWGVVKHARTLTKHI